MKHEKKPIGRFEANPELPNMDTSLSKLASCDQKIAGAIREEWKEKPVLGLVPTGVAHV